MCWDCIYILGVNLNENENNDKENTRENAALKLIIKNLKQNMRDVCILLILDPSEAVDVEFERIT